MATPEDSLLGPIGSALAQLEPPQEQQAQQPDNPVGVELDADAPEIVRDNVENFELDVEQNKAIGEAIANRPPMPEDVWRPGEKPSPWSDIESTDVFKNASTDKKLQAYDKHALRVNQWVESQEDYTPKMRAEITKQIREKRSDIAGGKTIGEYAKDIGKGLVDSTIASLGGMGFAGLSMTDEQSREEYFEMLGANWDKAIDYVLVNEARAIPAARKDQFERLKEQGFTVKKGSITGSGIEGMYAGEYIDRREKLDNAIKVLKDSLDEGLFPDDPTEFRIWLKANQDQILREAQIYNQDDVSYTDDRTRKFTEDLDLVNKLANYTATRNDAVFNAMIQQMVRSSDRQKADDQWERVFREGQGLVRDVQNIEQRLGGSGEVSQLIAQGGTDPVELGSSVISTVLSGGTARAIGGALEGASRARRVGQAAANTVLDVAVEAGTEAFQSLIEDPNSDPYAAAADGAVLALAFQLTGAALGAGRRAIGSVIREDAQAQDQAAIPDIPGETVPDVEQTVTATETVEEPAPVQVDEPVTQPQQQTIVEEEDLNAPITSVLDEIAREEASAAPVVDVDERQADVVSETEVQAPIQEEVTPVEETVVEEEIVEEPAADIQEDPLVDEVVEPSVDAQKAVGSAPDVVRSFDLDEVLRADLVQNADGSVSVRKINKETGAEIPLQGAEQAFPDVPSALDFVNQTFQLEEVTDGSPSLEQRIDELSSEIERGETDPLMDLLRANKIQPTQTDIRTIGRVSRRERSGFRALDRDAASRGDYYGAPLIRDYEGNPQAQQRLRSIYDRNSSLRPDQVAEIAYNTLGPNYIAAPTAEALWDAIKQRLDGDAGRVSRPRSSDAEIEATVRAYEQGLEDSYNGFINAVQSPWRSGGAIRAGDLQVGDRFEAGDVTMEVTEVSPDAVTIRSDKHGSHSIGSDDLVGYDTFEENGIPLTEREGTAQQNIVSRDETSSLTLSVRDALAQRGTEWNGRVLTSREHSSMVRSRSQLEAARNLAQLFGRRVVGVTGDFPANGAVVPGDTSNIFLRVDSTRSELTVAAHEMLHVMKRTDPDLYNELAITVEADLTAYVEQVRPEHAALGLSQEVIAEEFLADYLAERAGDPRFWESLAARQPNLFERFANFVVNFLREIHDLIVNDRIKVEQYIRNAAEMRNTLEGVLVAFKARQEKQDQGLLDGFDEDMPFSDWDAQRSGQEPQPSRRLYEPSPPVTKEAQQVFGEQVGRPDEVQTIEELQTTVRNHYFDGTRPVSDASIADALAVLNDVENGLFDASLETGLDGANAAVIGELYNFARRILAETGDNSMLARMQGRSNDYFDRSGTRSGRDLNARRQYSTPLEETLSKVEEGKKAVVDEVGFSEGAQVVKLSAELEKLNKELDAMRIQLEQFQQGEIASIVELVEGKRGQGTGNSERIKRILGATKADTGKRVSRVVAKAEKFLDVGGIDLVFSDVDPAQAASREERLAAIAQILQDQIGGKRRHRSRSRFVANLVRLGMSEEAANAKFDESAAIRAEFEEALKADRAENAVTEETKTASELLVEALDAESKRIDRLNQAVDRLAEKLVGKKRVRKEKDATNRSDLEKFVEEQGSLGENFDREAAIKQALRMGVKSESAAKLADAIQASIKQREEKNLTSRAARKKDVNLQAKEIAKRFDNPDDVPRKREDNPLRVLVRQTLRQNSTITQESFMARAKEIGVNEKEAANLWRSLDNERQERQRIRDLKRQEEAEAQPDREAQRIIETLAASQSDTQDNRERKARENVVREIYRDYVSHGAYGERPGPPMSRPGFIAALVDEGVSQQQAETLATLADRERQNREQANLGRGAANAVERSVPFIMREILNHPQLRIVGPEARIRIMASLFEERAGMSPVDARAAAQRMNHLVEQKWEEAANRLAEQWISSRVAPGFKRETPKTTKSGERKGHFDIIREAVRAGAYDPRRRTLDEVAKQNGWTDLTESELRELAELDEQLQRGIGMEGLTWLEEIQMKRRMARIINQSSVPPSIKRLLREYYHANIFSGVRTWFLQHSVLANAIANIGLRDLLAATVGTATGRGEVNLTGYFNAVMRIGDALRNGLSDAGVAFTTGATRGALEKEIIEGQSYLEQVYDKNLPILQNPRSTIAQRTMAATKIMLSSSRFAFRVLGAFDGFYQGVIRTYTHELELFSQAAGLGLTPQQIRETMGNVMLYTDQFKDEAAQKFENPSLRQAYVNDRLTLAMYDAFEGNGVPRSFINESRQRSFNEAEIETGVNEFETGTSGISQLAQIVQKYAREGNGPMGWLASFLIAVVRTPYNVFHRSAWWFPTGLIRLANVAKKTQGFKVWKDDKGKPLSPYEKSLADPHQLMRRSMETALGTAFTLGLAGLLFREEGKDDDEKLFRINLGGPKRNETSKFTAWRQSGRRPFTIQFRATPNSDWVTVGFRRGGMEFFNFAATVLGSWEQKEFADGKWAATPEGAYISTLASEMAGETFFFLRPFTSRYSLASTDAMGSQLGFLASGFIPFSSMLRTPQRIARDYQEAEPGFLNAFMMQLPIVPMLSPDTPALNSLGDPLGAKESELSYAFANFGIPLGYIPFNPRTKPGQGEPTDKDVYLLLREKDYFPSMKPLRDFRDDLSLTTYREFVQLKGGMMKDWIKQNYARLDGMEPERFKQAVINQSQRATRTAQQRLKIR